MSTMARISVIACRIPQRLKGAVSTLAALARGEAGKNFQSRLNGLSELFFVAEVPEAAKKSE